MTSSRTAQIPQLAFATASTVLTSLWTGAAAFASQGPGTASSFPQLAMAIIVYGGSALVVGTGLIGAMRRR